MSYKRVLSIQDISCFGQCSLTVALPLISACGVECSILPSAVLSTHTAGFSGYTVRDLSGDFADIFAHWNKSGIKYDAIYTGYLGSTEEVASVMELMDAFPSLRIVDPAMADNGVLYPAFDMAYVSEMKKLCSTADIVIPNITEACMLTDMPYKTEYDESYIRELIDRLSGLGAKTVILTGVSYKAARTGVAVFENGTYSYYEHKKIDRSCHGTGDVYASAFVGALFNGNDAYTSAKIAADFTVRCIENTIGDEKHWYGVKFETMIPELIAAVRK